MSSGEYRRDLGLRVQSFPKLGVPYFGGPDSKDYSILESIVG